VKRQFITQQLLLISLFSRAWAFDWYGNKQRLMFETNLYRAEVANDRW